MVLLSALLACGQSGRSNAQTSASAAPAVALAKTHASVGDKCLLTIPGSNDNVLLFETPEAMDEFAKAAAAKDDVGMQEVFRRSGMSATPGTECLVIERTGFLSQKSKVRVRSGPHMDKAGWTMVEWVSPVN